MTEYCWWLKDKATQSHTGQTSQKEQKILKLPFLLTAKIASALIHPSQTKIYDAHLYRRKYRPEKYEHTTSDCQSRRRHSFTNPNISTITTEIILRAATAYISPVYSHNTGRIHCRNGSVVEISCLYDDLSALYFFLQLFERSR
jgi:hypothetical protein